MWMRCNAWTCFFGEQTTRHLEKMVDDLNAGKPQCPVGLNTLVLPRKSTLPPADQTPYVYLQCGHVQGLHHWGKTGEERTCPICLKVASPLPFYFVFGLVGTPQSGGGGGGGSLPAGWPSLPLWQRFVVAPVGFGADSSAPPFCCCRERESRFGTEAGHTRVVLHFNRVALRWK